MLPGLLMGVLLIIVPIFLPTAQVLGIDLVLFGVVAVVNAMMGLITPPYGLLLFIVASITKQPLIRIVRDLLPFLAALLIALGVITLCRTSCSSCRVCLATRARNTVCMLR